MTRISSPSLRAIVPTAISTLIFALAGSARADPDDHVTLGAGVGAIPAFQGSDGSRVVPIPIIDVEWGRFFIRLSDGIGVNAIDTPHFQAGAGLTWMPGYRGRDVPDGIGALSDSFGGRAFVSGELGGVMATVSVVHALFGGDFEGTVASAQVSYALRLLPRLVLSPGVGASWADGTYMQRYFGVNADQAAASGLPLYRSSAGIKDVSARLAANYQLTDSIGFVGVVAFAHYQDNVSDSPFVESRLQSTRVLGLTCTF